MKITFIGALLIVAVAVGIILVHRHLAKQANPPQDNGQDQPTPKA
jgi:hypothetical protein